MENTLVVKILDQIDYIKYESFVLSFKESLFYYSIKYKLFLENLLKCHSQYILIMKGDDIQAILPLLMKEGKYGMILNTLPYYGSNGGILAKTRESYNLLLDYYYKMTKEVSSSTYITNPFITEGEILSTSLKEEKLSQWTNIEHKDNMDESLMNLFESSTRRNIRKAIKSNVSIEVDNSQIEFLYQTHYDNISSIGGKTKSKDFFYSLDSYFEKGVDYNIYIASLNNKKIGALLLFYFNNTVEYFTPAIVNEFRSVQALPLIIYKAMLDSSQSKYKWWNWGGTWKTQKGVYKFKKKFGAIDKKYNYFITINNQDLYKATQEELIKEYDDFYVIPFNMLKGKE